MVHAQKGKGGNVFLAVREERDEFFFVKGGGRIFLLS